MKQSSMYRGIPAGNPLANILVIVVGTLVIAASIVVGFFAFLIVAAIVLVLGAVIGLRVWWFNRKLARQSASTRRPETTNGSGVIEGEYRVVADDKDRE